jgi:hypothetical protein
LLLTFSSDYFEKIFSRNARRHFFFFASRRESAEKDTHVQQRRDDDDDDDDDDDSAANVLQRVRAKSVDKQRGVGVLATPVRFTFDSDRTSRGESIARALFFFPEKARHRRGKRLFVRYFPEPAEKKKSVF